MTNNNQIDKTSYYVLPCGLNLEDYIHWAELDFNMGSAVKYHYRAGNKDGESKDKDLNKCYHYVRQIAVKEHMDPNEVYRLVIAHVNRALNWKPNDACYRVYATEVPDWRPSND